LATDETLARQLVVFTLGAEHYALPIEQVQEIINYDEPRSVASPLQWMRGVISLRGRIVPIIDLAARLGAAVKVSELTKIVIVGDGKETAGMIVDNVEEVLTVEDAQREPAFAAVDQTLIEAIVKIADKIVLQVKPEALFAGLSPAAG
jgi:purine-binding chemotaxis protein CheW